MRILIVDDERRARNRLAKLLQGLPGIEIAGEAEDGLSAIAAIEKEKPDLVLLDVQMPGLDGFEVLGELKPVDLPLIVFVTAYDQYALKAFEVSAVDYLLKPVTIDRLERAIRKAEKMIQSRDQAQTARDQISRLALALEEGRTAFVQRVIGRRGQKMLIIPAESVQAFVADSELVFAVTADGRHMVSHTLKELESRLDPKNFVRVHKQTIVNLHKIVEIDPMFKGGAVARLQCGIQIDISRRYAPALKQRLES